MICAKGQRKFCVDNFFLRSYDDSIKSSGKAETMNGELTMRVSSVVTKNGKKMAYVSFEGKDRSAEGEVPSCRIVTSDGFTEKECRELERYLRENIDRIRQMAESIHLIDALKS